MEGSDLMCLTSQPCGQPGAQLIFGQCPLQEALKTLKNVQSGFLFSDPQNPPTPFATHRMNESYNFPFGQTFTLTEMLLNESAMTP